MDTCLYVLRNEATALAFRHDTLDDALAALNYEVGERDMWVLFELDVARFGTRRVAEGQGHIKCPRSPAALASAGVASVDDATAFEWRRLFDRRTN